MYYNTTLKDFIYLNIINKFIVTVNIILFFFQKNLKIITTN